jgi:hypothetical protein
MLPKWYRICYVTLLFTFLTGILACQGVASILVLNSDEAASIQGSGNCKCRKGAYCGSVYCEKIGTVWKNCSGNTHRSFCVDSDTQSDDCDSDGASVPCGVWQECTSDQCSSCTPGSTSCNRTSSGADDDVC